MENSISEVVDGSEFAETAYDMSQAQAEKEFGAEFETDAEEMNGLEGVDHD
ncbi:hypothetical protein [Ferrovum myxofaciens]|uniref:hypothetical protein n=1 Tax=Ferrovum myxofaciens TaxID=416213 RepID=UPI000A584A32|nr:hypothetical protein [Ferrovum myxofaciens]